MVSGLIETMSPAIEASPYWRIAVRRRARAHDVILGKLRAGGAGMVGEDTQLGADREPFGNVRVRRIVAAGYDAVLLVGAGHDHVVEQAALRVAHRPVAVVGLLPLRAAVAAHGHPACIDDR